MQGTLEVRFALLKKVELINAYFYCQLKFDKKIVNICCVVKFFPWFKFYFPLFKTLSINHTLSYPKTTENKI